jgi:hypothetical protein
VDTAHCLAGRAVDARRQACYAGSDAAGPSATIQSVVPRGALSRWGNRAPRAPLLLPRGGHSASARALLLTTGTCYQPWRQAPGNGVEDVTRRCTHR